jgi:hypothetical protein
VLLASLRALVTFQKFEFFIESFLGDCLKKATLHDNKSQAQVLVMLSANVRVHPDTSTGARVENRPLSPTNVPSALLPGDGRPPTAWTEVQLGDEPEKKHAPLRSEASLQPGALESICLCNF